jgi:hypothetical protein
VEDWEQFFVEKSRRRFEKERAQRRRHLKHGIVGAAIIAALIAGAILALANLR